MHGLAELRAVTLADGVIARLFKPMRAFGSPYHRPTEGQRLGNQIKAALIFTWADFVNVVRFHFRRGSRFTITTNRTTRKIVCKINADQCIPQSVVFYGSQ